MKTTSNSLAMPRAPHGLQQPIGQQDMWVWLIELTVEGRVELHMAGGSAAQVQTEYL
jgi:hypothetical protein